MKFLFPSFLFALFAVAIPVIIHLFSFKRYKTVYFSNVGFLKDIKKESKKKSRLKQILILIARILAIVSLVFAFSQPYIPLNNQTKNPTQQEIGIYIDNSFSMNALSETGQLLELARNKAAEICMAYPAGTKFKLLNNNLDPRYRNALTKDQFLSQLNEIKPSPIVLPLSMVLKYFINQNIEKESKTEKAIYFLSDFQKSISDFENLKPGKIKTFFVPLKPNEVANIYIDSCWVEEPAHRLNQEETVFVKIKNSSKQDFQNLPLKLSINDSVKSITSFSVEAQNQVVAELKYSNNSSGLQRGKIEITDYPFTHDNTWYISYFVKPAISALAIYNSETNNEGLANIEALFADDSFIRLSKMSISALQVSTLTEYNTIFLLHPKSFSSGFLNELERAVAGGSSVVLIPETQRNVIQYNLFLSKFNTHLITGLDTVTQKISGVDFESKFYKNVFSKKAKNATAPEIREHLQFEKNTNSQENRLLWFQNNELALSETEYKNGKVWVFGFSFKNRNAAFLHDVLFVPTLYNIVLNSLPTQQISYIVGRDNSLVLSPLDKINADGRIEIENQQSGTRFIPERTIIGGNTRIDFTGQISTDGHFNILNNEKFVTTMSFNYNRNESELSYFWSDEIQNRLKENDIKNAVVISDTERNFNEIINELQNGKQLWKLFILMALFFILSETLISRFMK